MHIPRVLRLGSRSLNFAGIESVAPTQKSQTSTSTQDSQQSLAKAPTGIAGFDEITMGGLPRGRATLICGGAGCGKTVFGLEFLVNGIEQFGENGVCVSFEETAQDLAGNARSLGFDLPKLQKARKLAIDYIYIDKSEIAETGEYGLDGLFVRLGAAIDSVNAKRVLIDTPEALFAGLSDTGVLRSELRRLFRWLKDKGVSAIITGERGENTLTRHGLEEYVSDCVILLDQRLEGDVVTRRLRVLKYRGSTHRTNEYPFLIDNDGIAVLPVTSVELNHAASDQRISSGIPELDEMLDGKGFFRGSSILVTGTAGTGKTSIAGHFVDAACRRRERALYFAFEESPAQIIRNLGSIGLNLGEWVQKGMLHIEAVRPSAYGLEMHLVRMHRLLERHKPGVVVLDPISGLIPNGLQSEVNSLVLRIVDSIKQRGCTALFTAFAEIDDMQSTSMNISSLVDTWLLVRGLEANGERNRVMYVLKSRGMKHSNQVREFTMTKDGVKLRDVYLGEGGVLTGSARLVREAEDRREERRWRREQERRETEARARAKALEAQIAALAAEKEAAQQVLEDLLLEDRSRREVMAEDRAELGRSRGVGRTVAGAKPRSNGKGA